MGNREQVPFRMRWAGWRSGGLHPALTAAALLFAAVTLVYSTLWQVATRRLPAVELGFDFDIVPKTLEGGLHVKLVKKDSPAEKLDWRRAIASWRLTRH
jgi:hypothetical protein